MDEKPSISQQHIESPNSIIRTNNYTYDDEDFCYNYYIWNSNQMEKKKDSKYEIRITIHNIFCT